MDIRTKKNLFFGIPALLIIAYIIFIKFFDYGTLVVRSEPPYEILIYGKQSIQCLQNPCEIKLDRGDYSIGLYKIGYKVDSKSVKISLLKTSELSPEFKKEPYLEEQKSPPTSTVTQPSPKQNFQIVYDKDHKNWKLTKKDDPLSQPIVYFSKRIESSLLMGIDNKAILLDRDPQKEEDSLYYIDADTNSKNLIGQVPYNIIGVKPSFNGRYFLLKTDQNQVFLAGFSSLKNIGQYKFETIFWTPQNKLILISQTEGIFKFELLDPGTDKKEELLNSSKILSPLEGVAVSKDENAIYFTSNKKYFKLNF